VNRMHTSSFAELPHLAPGQFYRRVRRHFLRRNSTYTLDDSPPCVFVLSTGRAGTQTLASIFQISKNAKAYHEPAPKLFGLSKLSYWYFNDDVARKILAEAFLTARSELLRDSLQRGKIYVETSPQTTFLAPVIAQSLPTAKFIHLVRDPRDVVRSGMRRGWYDGHRLDKTRISPLPESEQYARWLQYSAFQKNLWLWNETNRWILNFFGSIPPNDKLLVHAEDIFMASSEVLTQIFDFVDSPPPPRKKVERILRKRLNAQQRGSFPKPEQWEQHQITALRAMCGDTAAQLGYNIQ